MSSLHYVNLPGVEWRDIAENWSLELRLKKLSLQKFPERAETQCTWTLLTG